MAGSSSGSRRAAPRVAVALDLTLARQAGRPVTARTVDLCAGGCCVRSERPLRVDEELEFDLVLDGETHVTGIARVLRQQATTYALRFERLLGEGAQRVADVVNSATTR